MISNARPGQSPGKNLFGEDRPKSAINANGLFTKPSNLSVEDGQPLLPPAPLPDPEEKDRQEVCNQPRGDDEGQSSPPGLMPLGGYEIFSVEPIRIHFGRIQVFFSADGATFGVQRKGQEGNPKGGNRPQKSPPGKGPLMFRSFSAIRTIDSFHSSFLPWNQ